MKKISTVLLGIYLCFNAEFNAQLAIFDPIKTPYDLPQTLIDQLMLGYPNVVTQIPDGTAWINSEKISAPKNTQGNITLFGMYEWDSVNNTWEIGEQLIQFTYTYNGSNDLTSFTRSLADSTGIPLMIRTTSQMIYSGSKLQSIYFTDEFQGNTINGIDSMTYNGNDQLIERGLYYIFGGNAMPINRYVYTYTANNVTEELLQASAGGGSSWEDDEKITFTYDGQNRIVSSLKETYDVDLSVWSNDESNSYTYAANGKLFEHENYTNWNGSAYDSIEKTIYTYDVSNLLVELVGQKKVGGNWENDEKSLITYNGTEPFEGYTYLWNGTAFSSTASTKTIWDDQTPVETAPIAPSNLMLEPLRALQTIRLTWTDNATNEIGFIVERSTDGVNFTQVAVLATANTQTFDDTELPEETTYYYRVLAYNTIGNSSASNIAQATTGSGTSTLNELSENMLMVYPNPASQYLSIEVNSKGNYTISSVLGTVYQSGELLPGTTTLNTSTLEVGSYFVKVENEKGCTINSIVISK